MARQAVLHAPAHHRHQDLDVADLVEVRVEGVLRKYAGWGSRSRIHALGDRALDTVFVALESALAAGPAPHPPRIEHNRIVRPDQLHRYAELGALPVVFGQPFTCQIIDGGAWSALQHEEHWVAPARPWFDPWRAATAASASSSAGTKRSP